MIYNLPRVKLRRTFLAASLDIGGVVKLMDSGVATEYVAVHQGIPDSTLYDSSCNGTWLLRKDILDRLAWHNSNSNIYASSNINAKLNSDYINGLGPLEQSLIKQVKIPYVNGTGSGGSVASGSDGLSVKAFLLGGYEVGFTTTTSANFPVDGAALSYFAGTADTDTKRIANYNGAAGTWRLRSPDASTIGSGWLVNVYGASASSNVSNVHGIRPCIILPFTAEFDSETKELVGNANGLPYLMFTSPESFTLSTVNNGGYPEKSWNGTVEYSINTTDWTEWDGTITLSSSSNNELYLRGFGNSIISGPTSVKWVLTGNNIQCIGNIETLLDYRTVWAGGHPAMDVSCFRFMFNDCTSLTTAPELPATTLSQSCYYSMFKGCTSLIAIPTLPATILSNYCYYEIFSGCAKIKLSATQTGTYTQEYRVPVIGTGTTASLALGNMFFNTGGTFTGTPEINTTYYLDSSNAIL